MSWTEGWDAIVEALRDGEDETALAMFEDVVREQRGDAYQDGLDDGRDERREEPRDQDLDDAVVCLKRGDRAEALILLERFLGSEFIGLLTGGPA